MNPPALLSALLFGIVVAAQAAACTPDFKGALTVESARYTLAWRTQPAAIPVGGHFAIDFVVCPKAGVPMPKSLRIDAQMPEHRHGMNYKAQVVAASGGRYNADGLMFHMPGRWEFIFDVRSSGRTDRLTQSFVLE